METFQCFEATQQYVMSFKQYTKNSKDLYTILRQMHLKQQRKSFQLLEHFVYRDLL